MVRKTTIFISAILGISLLMAFISYPFLPDQIPMHWNARGEVDGVMPKSIGLFVMPAVTAFILLLFLLIPLLDPLKENIEKFRKYFDAFMGVLALFMLYIYVLSMLFGLGLRFDMRLFLLPALAVLFYCAGLLIERCKRNWFIGIRTPWTLSDDRVWAKTHRIGARLFKIFALVIILAMFLGSFGFALVIGYALAITAYLVAYSYIEYRKRNR